LNPYCVQYSQSPERRLFCFAYRPFKKLMCPAEGKNIGLFPNPLIFLSSW
jgi:hypothetical protein